MKIKKIFALVISALMLTTLVTGCAKNEEENKTVREVVEAPVSTPDVEDNSGTEYKEEFYFYNNVTKEQYMLGLTETEFQLIKLVNAGEYVSTFLQSNGTYSVDADGNYVLDRYTEKEAKLFFSEYLIDSGSVNTSIKPIVLKKTGGLYFDNDERLVFVKQGETQDKFIWWGDYSDNTLVLTQGAEKPTSMLVFLVDGKTGVAERIELKAENFTQLDTSVIGNTTATVTYENVEYTVDVKIKSTWGSIIEPTKYNVLTVAEGLPVFVAKGTSYQEYFAKYQGTDPLFYYTDGTEKIAVTDYTVDGWETEKVANGRKMYYRVSAEIEDRIFRYVGCVCVCASEDEIAGDISNVVYENENVDKTHYGLWFVPKGSEISGIKGDLYKLGSEIETGVELAISEYDADKLGPQKIKLTYNGVSCEQMIYVYDSTNAIVSKIELVGLKQNEDGTAVDYADGSVRFTYCDGTTRDAAIDGYKNSITESVETDGSISVCFNYNAIIDSIGYPFSVTSLVAPNAVE